MDLPERVSLTINSNELLKSYDRVIVACSGGADSLALLHLLHATELSLELKVVYIDHQLRPDETSHEIELVTNCCDALGVDFESRTVDVLQLAAEGGCSVEEAARTLRYKALDEVRQTFSAKAIAVAHTADDQVEEFFIRLLRGSSTKGLSGMAIKRDCIIRPLLHFKKAELTEFLSGQDIAWCEDSSNQSRQFLRNRVRLDLLPLMKKDFNPAIDKIILQNMDLLKQEDDFLEEQTSTAYANCVHLIKETSTCTEKGTTTGDKNCNSLYITSHKFLEYHPAIGRRILEKCCWQMATRPTYEQIGNLIELIAKGENGKELHLSNGIRAEKSSKALLFKRPLAKGQRRGSEQPARPVNQMIPGPGTYPINGTDKELILKIVTGSPAVFSNTNVRGKKETIGHTKEPVILQANFSKITFPLQLRSFQAGEKFTPLGSQGRKKISRYLNEKKIPQKERPHWPVLLCQEKVVAIAGLQIDHSYRLAENSNKLLSIEWRTQK